MEAREVDTAKVTSAMGRESASILGSSSRVGKRGWGNLERERSMVRMDWGRATGEAANWMGQDKGGYLWGRREEEEASFLSLSYPPGNSPTTWTLYLVSREEVKHSTEARST